MADPILAVNGIAFSVGSEAECPEIVRLLVEAFLKTDPLALGVGLTAAEFETFVTLLAAPVVGQDLTIVARSVETGELAGVLLTEDSAAPPGWKG